MLAMLGQTPAPVAAVPLYQVLPRHRRRFHLAVAGEAVDAQSVDQKPLAASPRPVPLALLRHQVPAQRIVSANAHLAGSWARILDKINSVSRHARAPCFCCWFRGLPDALHAVHRNMGH